MMYVIFIDAHHSGGDQLVMHIVFRLRGIDLFKVTTRVCASTHSPIMYVLHTYRCPPLRRGSTGDAWCVPIGYDHISSLKIQNERRYKGVKVMRGDGGEERQVIGIKKKLHASPLCQTLYHTLPTAHSRALSTVYMGGWEGGMGGWDGRVDGRVGGRVWGWEGGVRGCGDGRVG